MTTYAGAILPSGLPSNPAYGAAYKFLPAPLTLPYPSALASNPQVIIGGAANGARGIAGDVSVANSQSLTDLTVDDTGDPTAVARLSSSPPMSRCRVVASRSARL